jgi:hypothetical protein
MVIGKSQEAPMKKAPKKTLNLKVKTLEKKTAPVKAESTERMLGGNPIIGYT